VSSLVERLREVIRPVPPERPRPDIHVPRVSDTPEADGPDARPHPATADAAAVLDGQWQERRGQRFVVIDRKYSPGYRHGRIAVADGLPPADGMWARLPLLAGTSCSGRMLFVDLETTGLAGGAGSYAFLIGCGWFESGSFRVRQFFLSSFAGERGLLEAVVETAGAAGTIVTYNGKSFDVPLMETRFLLHRMDMPFAGRPHVDMLHPARRLWRRSASGEPERWDTNRASGGPEIGGGSKHSAPGGGDCRLSTLEDVLCGHRREGDVAGFEIPSRYFHYVRSGDARALAPVLEHNRLDLVALALVTAHAAQLLEDGPASARTAREALGMGRLYERAGLDEDASAAFERAALLAGGDVVTRAEALRACALLARRQRRHDDAAAAWRRILELRGAPAGMTREATDALAVHHEHRLRDPLSARTFALQSMKLPQTVARRQAVQHRLGRLNRKLGETPAPSLFTS
jgi:uncharacterized protein YprB with RNaseH-like and TPR domain